MKTRFLTGLLPLLAIALAGCAQTATVSSAPIPERDLAAAAAATQGATVLDVDKFTPTVTIGESCTPRALKDDATPPSPKLAATLAQAAEYSLAQQGVGLLVMKDGAVIHRSFAEGTDQDTPTDSYSMHKSVLALAFGEAIDAGLIRSLDDPASRYIKEWDGDPRGDITLRELLTMSSGLKLSSGIQDLIPLLFSADINAVALARPAVEPPGLTFGYSNADSQIAGIALGRALVKGGYSSYAQFLEQKIWCPVGNDAAKIWLDREGGAPHYYSGMFTDIENWARLGELIRNQGMVGGTQVVPASWIAEMGKPSAANPAYGLQIWRGSPWNEKRAYNQQNPIKIIHSEPYLADDVLFFDGFGGQRVYVIPSAGVTIARTGQVNLAYDDAKIVNLVLAGLE